MEHEAPGLYFALMVQYYARMYYYRLCSSFFNLIVTADSIFCFFESEFTRQSSRVCGAGFLLGNSRWVRCCILFKPHPGSGWLRTNGYVAWKKNAALYACVPVSDCDECVRDQGAAMRSLRWCLHVMMITSSEKSFCLHVTKQPIHFDTIQACRWVKRIGVSSMAVLL